MVKLDPEEKDVVESFDRGEWQPVKAPEAEIARYQEYARATFRKDARVTIRISKSER